MKELYDLTIYISLSNCLYGDLISFPLSTHKVSVTMETQSAPLCSMALQPAPLWRETTAVFTFGRQTGSLRAAMFVFVPDT